MKKNIFLNVLAIFYISILTACVSSLEETPLVDLSIIEDVKETFPELTSTQFGEPQYFADKNTVVELSAEQKKEFLNYFNSAVNNAKPDHQRLYEFLELFGDKFEYGNLTSNAKDTFAQARGNCMSLAVLTTALARVANVEIKYQLVNRIPVYQEYGSVIFNAQHIRSLVFEPKIENGSGLLLFRKKAVIDYYPSSSNFVSGNVSEDDFFSMYYRNLASEAIGINDNNKAYWLLRHSLDIEPENAQSINSLAVLHRRVGEYAKAEELYKYGIKNASNKITLLKNYKILLQSQERFIEAERITKELENLIDYDPFNWLHAANDAFDEGNYNLAFKLYNKAIELAPYLHQAHFGVAKTQYMRGNYIAAERSFKVAQDEAFDKKSKSIYEAKLSALSKERFN